MNDQERCPTCGNVDKLDHDYIDVHGEPNRCGDPWHDSAPSSVAPKGCTCCNDLAQIAAEFADASRSEDKERAAKHQERAMEILAKHVSCVEYEEGSSVAEQPQPIDALILRFSAALREKLIASEKKYGWQNGWLKTDWADDLRADIREHVDKGDPRDVAAYCAFAWWHGWSLASPKAEQPSREQPVPSSKQDEREREIPHCEAHDRRWLVSAETGEPLYCDLCDLTDQLRDMQTERDAERKRVQELQQQVMALKLGTCSTLWWDGDISYSSPEEYAEQLGLALGTEFALQGARYRAEKYKVTKVSDDANDDYECDHISGEPKPEDFPEYFKIAERVQELEGALRKLHDAASCIRHWHDVEPDGMVVSRTHVFALWQQLKVTESILSKEQK